jgi:O-acetyl-ADP-ribose deacetylase (regulator of RNase III)
MKLKRFNRSNGRRDKATVRAVRGDITTLDVDAIVNAANELMRGGGGVDGAIHAAAGPGLLQEEIDDHPDGCPTGEARVTSGHNLPARWIIHTVGPRWYGGDREEPELLASCYRESLRAAALIGARSVAFPAISTKIFGYPPAEAAPVAVNSVREFLERDDHRIDEVILVGFDDESFGLYKDLV